jgi:hypothetical protein
MRRMLPPFLFLSMLCCFDSDEVPAPDGGTTTQRGGTDCETESEGCPCPEDESCPGELECSPVGLCEAACLAGSEGCACHVTGWCEPGLACLPEGICS